MKLQQPGGPGALTLAEVPIPEPGPDEVLVRVAACGFCHHDLLLMKGTLRRGVKPGLVPGHEISGVVVQVGENVSSLKQGERVVLDTTEKNMPRSASSKSVTEKWQSRSSVWICLWF